MSEKGKTTNLKYIVSFASLIIVEYPRKKNHSRHTTIIKRIMKSNAKPKL